MEGALEENEERYRRITSAITDYIFTVYVEDGVASRTLHTPVCEPVTGYTAEEFNQDPFLWFNMVVEEDQERVRAHIAGILRGEDRGGHRAPHPAQGRERAVGQQHPGSPPRPGRQAHLL
ncbi:MAG: PAS domain-containing protein [Desulfobacterales bacterium]|nr:PAS domain-containing protein [Desulfobacterales bacterium]